MKWIFLFSWDMRWAVIISILLLAIPLWGQTRLLVEKPGKVKKIALSSGAVIKFQLKEDHKIYKREILGFRDSLIIFENFEVHIDEIGMIRIPMHPRIRKYSEFLIAAGGILFVADQINNSIVNDNDFSLSRGVTTVSISMISTGFLLRFVQKRTYRFPGKRKLKII